MHYRLQTWRKYSQPQGQKDAGVVIQTARFGTKRRSHRHTYSLYRKRREFTFFGCVEARIFLPYKMVDGSPVVVCWSRKAVALTHQYDTSEPQEKLN
ncbi:hypothetical protein TcasGA2_TC005645 [Tribolium castaneum]|uniref:Uncharacterized protein n=1 Tax=Tribolium castaneum TaxID=7070 RepID=D6WX31_TRICA|nr:hypothetical protein TcasGA2_TC005645 [Tribolium castaneum]